MPIAAEQFNGSKMAVSGRQAEWVAGDEVKINSTTATVALSDNKAYLQGNVLEANVYRAIYPASIASSGTLTDDNISITLPSTYTYREADGKQQIALPMAAVGREFPLMFKHLTAGLVVSVYDSAWVGLEKRDIYLDKIVVASKGYKLSGGYTFDITDIGNNVLCTTSSAGDTVVTMNFENEAVRVAFNNSKQVIIPIPAVGANNKFKVTVTAHYKQGSTAVTLAKSLTQEVGGSLGRNTLAYAPIKLKGTETLGAEDVVPEEDEDGSVLIGTVAEFNQYASLITAKSGGYDTMRYKLTADLDFNNATTKPIENFAGTFNGNGHTIKNISISTTTATKNSFYYFLKDSSSFVNKSSSSYSSYRFGLFNNLGGPATIENLTLQNITINPTSGNARTILMAGAIVGYTNKNVTIRNCTVDNFKIASYTYTTTNKCLVYVGICVGYSAANQITIENCNVVNCTPKARVCNKYSDKSTNYHQLYYGGLLGLLQKGTFTATNNTLSGAMHVAFHGGYSESNNGKYLTGTLLGAKVAGTATFTNNTSMGMQLYKPNGTTANAEATQGHQESGN